MRVPRAGVDLVPPAQPDEAPPGDVLQVVEIGGEEEHGEDEDEDAKGAEGVSEDGLGGGEGKEGGGRRETNKLSKKGM